MKKPPTSPLNPLPTHLLAQAVTAANDAVIITGADLNPPGPLIEYVNPAFSEMTGYTFAEVLGKSPRLLQGPKTDRQLLERLKRNLTELESFSGETVNYRKDGSEYHVEWRISPIYNEDGQLCKWVAIQRDMTERRQFEEGLARLAAIVESTDDAIVGKDLAGVITSWNSGAERLFGYSSEEMIGQNIRRLLPDDRLHEEDEILQRICGGERITHFETVRLTKDDRLVDVSVTISPIRDGSGRIIGASKIARDITLTRVLAAESERLLVTERQLREAAERANQIKNGFLATLSHELRAPLSAILGWAQILRSGSVSPEEQKKAVDIIYRNSQLQSQLIGDLLDINKILMGKLHLDMRIVELEPIIRAAVNSVAPSAEAKNINLQMALDPLAKSAWVDPTRLQQIIWNLLANAIKFTPAGGRVDISTCLFPTFLTITVTDNGIGISPDLLPTIFDRFVQADSSTTRRYGGLGLGLSIAKHLVESQGGQIQAFSEGEGRGATFRVLLPSPQEGRKSERVRESRLPTLAGLVALVVDDDPDTADLLCHILQNCGARVETSHTAAEALQHALTPFHLVISDIGMPEMDGYQLMRELRARRGEADGRFYAIALTAFSRDEDRAAAVAAGFDLFLTKPINPEELLGIVHRAVRTDSRSPRPTPGAGAERRTGANDRN